MNEEFQSIDSLAGRPRHRAVWWANVIFRLFCAGLPATALGAFYIWVTSVADKVVRLDCWTLWMFAGCVAALSAAFLFLGAGNGAWRANVLRLILAIAVSVGVFSASFVACDDAIGVVKEWQTVTFPEQCSVSFPSGPLEETGGNAQIRWGSYRWKRKHVAVDHQHGFTLTVVDAEFDRAHKPPELLEWLVGSWGMEGLGLMPFKWKDCIVEGRKAVTVSYQHPMRHGPRYQVLFVVDGQRGYVLAVSTWNKSLAANAEVLGFFKSLRILN
jgi:hypothetical protein